MIDKTCETCDIIFPIWPYEERQGRKYCSKKCHNLSKRGKPSWNKGKKMSKEFCRKLSEAHLGKMKGSDSPSWKGGEAFFHGYWYILQPDHPFSKHRYVKRARLVMETHLGRYLLPTEIVHHRGIYHLINSSENKQDDTIENLHLFPDRAEHARFHKLVEHGKISPDSL